jgi:hypothetical protein
MPLPSAKPAASTAAKTKAAAPRRKQGRAFLGMIDSVIVRGPVDFPFDGAIGSDDAYAAWMWMVRDLAPDLIDIEAIEDEPNNLQALESLLPDLLGRARKAMADAATSPETARRIRTQLGGEEAWERLPAVLNALRLRALLERPQSFGRAANGMTDEAALALALQAMPFNDPPVAAFLMQAAVGQVATPARLVAAAIRIAGGASEGAMVRGGFAPLIDAIMAHAQNQGPVLEQMGTFADMDLVCRAVDRFHRLMRAVTGYVELNRGGRWAMIAAALTKSVSERIEPKLRDVGPDLNKALRKREGVDRVDPDLVLSALNGIYLLATIRDSRDSLAVNALYDQVWSQTGQALEIHIERLLALVRANPFDKVTSDRFDAALKMAEVRFNADYAETLRRAKEAAERRA